MTNVLPLIDQYDKRLALSEEPENQRWRQFDESVHGVEHIADTLYALVKNKSLWHEVHECTSQKGQAALAEIQLRLEALLGRLLNGTETLHQSARECIHKQHELRENAAVLVFHSIEGYHAYRPPEVAAGIRPEVPRKDLYAPPTTRIDFFNPALGQPLPPSGASNINDGLAEPNTEDAAGVVRPHPLTRSDLVKDPTNSIPISNM